MYSLRQERLGDEIRDLLAVVLSGGRLSDPRLQGVTLTHVKLSGDLQLATVYYRVFGDATDADKGLQACRGLLRRHLASKLALRRVPELRFFFDESVENGERIEHLLSQVNKD